MKLPSALIIYLLLLLFGCAGFGGDLLIKVSGAVPTSGLPQNFSGKCRIEVVSVETGSTFSNRNISPEFSTTLMIVAGPKPKPYFFEVECDGRKFRSQEVMVSSRSSYSNAFDLGMLVEVK